MTQPPLQTNRPATDPFPCGGSQDPRTRTLILPQRILWTSASTDQASVAGADILLAPKFGQVPEGVFLAGSGCRLENHGAPASLLLDFGRELHGGLRLAAGEPSARDIKVRVRLGESASEAMAELGERGAGNDHAIRDSVIDLPWLGVREIGHTGFRFVRLDLVSPGVLSLESVHAISLMRPMPWLGSFTCNDERLNAVWSTAARTLQLCCQEFMWDGIKRDRLVWAGDLHPEVMSVMAVFGPQPIVAESLDYLRKTTPPDKWMNGMPPYALWWIRCLHDWHHYTGDTAYLKPQHGYLKQVFANLEKHIGPDNRWALPFGFLDWPTQHKPAALSAGMQALMLMAFEDGARLGRALGDPELAAQCQVTAARLRRVRPEPEGSKQAAALLALAGLADPVAMNERVLSRDGVRGVSTFYGYYMLEARALAGDIQGGITTVRDYWGGMLDMGATSFWEDFNLDWCRGSCRIDELPTPGQRDIHGDFGEFCYQGFRHSLCHGWASGPAAWLSKHVLGIQIAEVGCRTMLVKPFLGELDWAEGCFPTPLGILHVRHERTSDSRVSSAVTAPDGMHVRTKSINPMEVLS